MRFCLDQTPVSLPGVVVHPPDDAPPALTLVIAPDQVPVLRLLIIDASADELLVLRHAGFDIASMSDPADLPPVDQPAQVAIELVGMLRDVAHVAGRLDAARDHLSVIGSDAELYIQVKALMTALLRTLNTLAMNRVVGDSRAAGVLNYIDTMERFDES